MADGRLHCGRLDGPVACRDDGGMVPAPGQGTGRVAATPTTAVFFAGAFDPGLILKRSTTDGFMGAAGLLIFAGAENELSDRVGSRLSLPERVGVVAARAPAADARASVMTGRLDLDRGR